MDPAHLADNLLSKALQKYLGGRLTPHLGRELFNTIRKHLLSEGLFDEVHVEEVFSRTLTRALDYLNKYRGSAVLHPRSWLHAIRRHETHRYLIELVEKDGASLEALLSEGNKTLPEVHLLNEERVDQIIRKALQTLAPRHREFLELDLTGAPQSEIKERMKIRSDKYWRKLKCEATKAMRRAILALWDNYTDSLF